MYRNFFKLREKPFKLTASSSIFHENQGITPAYNKLIEAIRSEQKLILLSGETGTGKTLCAEKLKADLEDDPQYHCVVIPFTSLPFDEILGLVCTDLNLNFGLGQDDDKLEILERFLTHGHSQIRSVVILIDEAQNLSSTILNGLVELVKLGIRSKRNIQIVVIARNESDLNLHHAHMAEFGQHLSTKCQLEALTFEDTGSYIKYHLKMAGAAYSDFFTEEAAAKVFELTQGRARAINVLCEHVLNIAAHEKETIIEPRHVSQAYNQQKFDDTIEMNSSLISDAIKDYVNEEGQILKSESDIATELVAQTNSDTADHSFSEIELDKDKLEPLITEPNTLETTHSSQPVFDQPISTAQDETIEFGNAIIHTDNEKFESSTNSKFNIRLWGFLALPLIAGLLYQANQHKILSYLETRQIVQTPAALPTTETVIPLKEKIVLVSENILPNEVILQPEQEKEPETKIIVPEIEETPISNISISEEKLPEIQTQEIILIDNVDSPVSKQEEFTEAVTTFEPANEIGSATEIDFLLEKAKNQTENLQLTNPRDDNAFASYKSILQIDPGNEQALQGIRNLKQMFKDWAENNIIKNKYDRAHHYYQKALIIDPEDQETLQALSELEEKIGKTKGLEIKTGLLELAENARLEDLKILLNKGAFPDAQDQKGNTPLMLATERGHVDVVEILLNNGANPDIKNSTGDTALMNAVWNKKTEIVDLLIKKQANINAANKRGWTPLMYAAVHGHLEILNRLTSEQANLEAQTDDQKTALAIAAYNGKSKIVKVLLDSGVQIDTQDLSGWTPLMSAAWNGYEPIVKMLLERGADKSIATPDGDNAFELASEQRHYSIVALLK
ncbi:MAG: ankyrin repeat domain-containing protein [Gammaproteobacteria bacterium]